MRLNPSDVRSFIPRIVRHAVTVTAALALALAPGGCPINETPPDSTDTDGDVSTADDVSSGGGPDADAPADHETPGADAVDDPVPVPNRPPAADAGSDFSISGRKPVELDGRGSSDPDGGALTFAWKQVGGPALTLTDAGTAQPRFDAPATDTNISLSFELTVRDGELSDTDTITVTVTPPRVLLSTSWGNASGNVNADMHWLLPSGDSVPVERAAWGVTGSESASRVEGLIEDGIHAFWVDVSGAGQTTDLVFRVDFLEYQFLFDDRITAGMQRLLVLDVQNGVPHLLYNGWLSGSDANSGRPSGVHSVEVLGGWRDGTAAVNGDVHLRTPNGTWQAVWRDDWAAQGFEHAYLPAALPLSDGSYRIVFDLSGGGESADVVFDMLFRDLPFRVERRVAGGKTFKVGVDVVEGEPFVVFNGWLQADEDGAGGLSGRRPLEAVAGFRDASGDMNVEINARLPDGSWTGRDSSDWDVQQFEHLGLAPDASLADGTYRFVFELHGSGRFADVDYRAALANWSFHYSGLLAGGTEHSIDVNVVGGVATEIANSWR